MRGSVIYAGQRHLCEAASSMRDSAIYGATHLWVRPAGPLRCLVHAPPQGTQFAL
jgi:hypothetical protein